MVFFVIRVKINYGRDMDNLYHASNLIIYDKFITPLVEIPIYYFFIIRINF